MYFSIFENYKIPTLTKLGSKISKIILSYTPVLVILFFTITFFGVEPVQSLAEQNDRLIERISKDFTNKFCNSIAFGLSEKSAMEFSNKENNLIFKKKKGINSLDKRLLANKIAVSVVEDCGYLVNLKGEEGIIQFENDYLTINNSIFEED